MARQHQMKYQGRDLRVYPDLSTALAKRRAAFKPVKGALYQKGVQFRLLYPARLRIMFKGESHIFNSPEDAMAFYERQVAT